MPFQGFPSIPSPPALFPSYLIPSLPFRRRKSSTDSTSSASSDLTVFSDASTASSNENRLLSGHTSHLRCARCAADLALSSQIISKGFTGRHGRAYLVAPSASSITPNPIGLHSPKAKNDALPNLLNTYTHKPVPRQLVTGAHTVGDISCAQCGSVLGWKYVSAEEEAQRYKVGKFILETKRVCRTSTWDSETDMVGETSDFGTVQSVSGRRRSSVLPPKDITRIHEDSELEFDSQNEDECDDLFMGVWTPQLAARRRKQKHLVKMEE